MQDNKNWALKTGVALLAATSRDAGVAALHRPAAQPYALDMMRAPALTFGTEFEIMGKSQEDLLGILSPVVPPLVNTPMTWGMRLGLSGLPHKGKDLGRWQLVPEMAFPLNTFEVISPALNATRKHEVARVAHALTAHGAYADGDTGFHVHLDHRTFTAPQLANLARLWHRHGALLSCLSNSNVRQRTFYARDMEPAFIESLEQPNAPQNRRQLFDAYARTHAATGYSRGMRHHALRFYALNFGYLLQGATVELRSFQFAERPEAQQAVAFVDLALALGLFVRDGGDVAALLERRFDATHPAQVLQFLDSLGLDAERFAATRTQLCKNAASHHGFQWFSGEVRGVITDAAVGAAALLGARWLRPNTRLRKVARWGQQGIALAATVRCGSTLLEAAGLSSYKTTYAAHEDTYYSLSLAGLMVGMAMEVLARR